MATKDSGGQRHVSRRGQDEEDAAEQGGEDVKERMDKLTDDVDAILDEIDEVLRRMRRSSSGLTCRRAANSRAARSCRSHSRVSGSRVSAYQSASGKDRRGF